MAKYLCWGAMGISGLMLLLFTADLVVQKPFSRIDPVVDIIGILASGIVGYLSWEASREQM